MSGKIPTQKELILEHCKAYGSITHWDATRLQPAVLVLHKRIGEMKEAGHRFRDEWEEKDGKRYVRHYYDGFSHRPTEDLIDSECRNPKCRASGFFKVGSICGECKTDWDT